MLIKMSESQKKTAGWQPRHCANIVVNSPEATARLTPYLPPEILYVAFVVCRACANVRIYDALRLEQRDEKGS